jgi:hypothetical protein
MAHHCSFKRIYTLAALLINGALVRVLNRYILFVPGRSLNFSHLFFLEKGQVKNSKKGQVPKDPKAAYISMVGVQVT